MTSKINYKKIWAILVALVMMVSVFSLCVFAEDEGTTSEPAVTTEAAVTTTAGEGATTTAGEGSTTTTTGGTTTDGHDHSDDKNKS